jgi:hypothetical protein
MLLRLQVMASRSPEIVIADDSQQHSARVSASLVQPVAIPIRGSADNTAMMQGVASPAAGPHERSSSIDAVRQAVIPVSMPPDGTGERASASVVIEVASALAAAQGLPGGDLCQVRLRSNRGAIAEDQVAQGFE